MAHNVFATRMLTQADQLARRLDQGGTVERRDLSTALLNLSKFVDHTVASNQKPPSNGIFFQHLKKFADFRYDEMLRPSVMVLMLSVKSACLAGWFKESDAEELQQIFNTLSKHFLLDAECCKPASEVGVLRGPNATDLAEHESVLKMVSERYFPTLMVSAVVISLVVKTGYQVRGCDFQVTAQLAANTKVRLFVCHKDEIETSKCLVTPPLLNILVNGKGVDKRVQLPVGNDIGPQLPSDITTSCRLGCNFLQIVGECSGSYVVAIVLMGPRPQPVEERHIEDYVSPKAAAETDDEVIVGRTRISLRCPISLKRIVSPVKGVSCRHDQAFDRESYVYINGKRPSWCCPCCNTYVNYLELRRDKRMEEILRDVDASTFDIVIHEDGSWARDADDAETREAEANKSSGDPNIILISSDDEDDGGDGAAGATAPRDHFVDRASSAGVDMDDRKPDTRSMHISQLSSAHTSASTGDPSRVVLGNVPNAVYSVPSENPNAYGSNSSSGNTTHLNSVSGSQEFTTMSWTPVQQASAGSPSSWPSSTLSSQTTGQPRPAVPPSSQAPGSFPSRLGVDGGISTGYLTPPLEQEVQAMQRQMQVQNSDIAYARMMNELRLRRMMHETRQQPYGVNPARQHTATDSTQHGQGPVQRVVTPQAAQQRVSGSTREGRTYVYTGAGLQQTGPRHQNADLLSQANSIQHSHAQMYRLAQQVPTTSSRASPGAMPQANGSSLQSPSGGPHQGPVPRQSHQHPTYRSGTPPTVRHAAVAGTENAVGRNGWVPGTQGQAPSWRPAGRRMRGAIAPTSTSQVNGDAHETNTGATQLPSPSGPVMRVRPTSNASSMVPGPVAQRQGSVSGSSWVAHGNAIPQGGTAPSAAAEFHTIPEPLSPPPPLDEVIPWPVPTIDGEELPDISDWLQLDNWTNS